MGGLPFDSARRRKRCGLSDCALAPWIERNVREFLAIFGHVRAISIKPARDVAVETEQPESDSWKSERDKVFVNLPAFPNLPSVQVPIAVDVVNREQFMVVHATTNALPAVCFNNLGFSGSVVSFFLGEDSDLVFQIIPAHSFSYFVSVLPVAPRIFF